MKRILTTTAAAVALASLLGAPLAAQDATLSGTVTESFGQQIVVTTPEGRLLVTLPASAEQPSPGARVDLTGTRTGDTFTATALTVAAADPAAAPAAPAPAPAASEAEAGLPTALQGLGLTDVRSRPDDDGETYHFARLPEGGWLRAESRGDRLQEVQSDGAALPASLVAALLPDAARAEPRFADITRLTEIELDDDEIKVEGTATDGMRIEMEFSLTGTLTDYERERDNRRSLTDAQARDQLTALGYTDIGFVERGGRHVEVLATNTFGDLVEVRLDEQGRVERERLWQR